VWFSLSLSLYPNTPRHAGHTELAAPQPHSFGELHRTQLSSHLPQYTCQCVSPPGGLSPQRAFHLSHHHARAAGCRKSECATSVSPRLHGSFDKWHGGCWLRCYALEQSATRPLHARYTPATRPLYVWPVKHPLHVLRVDSVGTRLGLGWDSVGTRLGLGWDSVGARLGLGWDSVGARLGLGWDSVGARLGLIKSSLTTRLWSRL
jgi:hypothetical protein